MASVLDSVDQRTKLAGHNRMELLLFHFGSAQVFGINVFKVKEVVRCPEITKIPESHPSVVGVANMRGITISIIDLAKAIGTEPCKNIDDGFVIVTEYNRNIQGFLVDSVDRIINVNWSNILPPPKGSGDENYLTAVTEYNDKLIELLDVEKVLSEIIGQTMEMSEEVVDRTENFSEEVASSKRILVVDDSAVARKQIVRTLEQIQMECEVACNGREALTILQQYAEKGDVRESIAMVISDVEMPDMDGYTLTTEIRKDERLKVLYVLLHSSLSGISNSSMVEKVGANNFIAKFNADELATGVFEALDEARLVGVAA